MWGYAPTERLTKGDSLYRAANLKRATKSVQNDNPGLLVPEGILKIAGEGCSRD
jgi:hypothetical protein